MEHSTLKVSRSATGVERMIAILDSHRQKFLSFVRARIPEADAEDVVQHALARAYAKAATLREADQAVPWFYRILRHTVADFHTRRVAQEITVRKFAAEFAPVPQAELASCACGLDLLSGLNDNYREMLRRVDLNDEPLADVARSLKITRENATVRLHRARTVLRERVMTRCGMTSTGVRGPCAC